MEACVCLQRTRCPLCHGLACKCLPVCLPCRLSLKRLDLRRAIRLSVRIVTL